MVRDYRYRNNTKTAASQQPTPAWVTAHKIGDLDLSVQPAGGQHFRKCLSQVPVLIWASRRTQLVFDTSKQSGLSEWLSQVFIVYILLRREGSSILSWSYFEFFSNLNELPYNIPYPFRIPYSFLWLETHCLKKFPRWKVVVRVNCDMTLWDKFY